MIEPWRIVTRIKGRVESWEPGQSDRAWAPIFRSRRLNNGALVHVCVESDATVALASRFALRVTGPGIFPMDNYLLDALGRQIVFDARTEKIAHDIARALGSQCRFDIEEAKSRAGQPIGARG